MISVIIPTYNRAKTIERSVRSVLNQTYKDIECIVIDDCSTDNTKEIIMNINDSRLRYYCLDRNSGACAARNYGISKAKGDFIAFQDSDDIWKENKLVIQMNALSKNDADICFCAMKKYSVNENSFYVFPYSISNGFVSHKKLCFNSIVSTQTILARKTVFDKYIFDENVKKAQDYEWAIRASREYKFFFLEEILVDTFLQKDSISVLKSDYDSQIEVNEYLCDKYKNDYLIDKDAYIGVLNKLANVKTLSGVKASKEYRELAKLTNGKECIKSYLKYILSKMGLLRFILLHRHNKGIGSIIK